MKKDIDRSPKFYDFFFLMRPILFIPLWASLFLGYAAGAEIPSFGIELFPSSLFWINLLSYTLLMGAIYVVNQIYDRESDLVNNKLFLIPYGIIDTRKAWIFSAALVVLSFAISFLFSTLDFVVILILSLILGILYSVPPFQFKGRPFIDALSNGTGYGIFAYLAGWAAAAPVNFSALLYSLPLFFFVIAIFLNTTVPDIEGDKKAGLITTGVFLGKLGTNILAAAFMFYALLASFIFMDIHILISSIIGVILFVVAIFDDSDYMSKVSYRISSFVFVLSLAIKFPLFLVLDVLIYVLLRMYYEKRFHYTYPTFFGR